VTRTELVAWHDRRITDGGQGPQSHASQAPASMGALARQHLGGWDTVERCGNVRWRRYASGSSGAMTGGDEGGGRATPVALHNEESLRVMSQQEEGVKVALPI
jgi:hypothetical protein